MGKFEGKRVIVTGAGIGIGFATVKAFAEAGATVALIDIAGALAGESAQSINHAIGEERVFPYGLDVADVSAVRAMVDDFTAQQGSLDILIANAGITNYGSFLDYTPEAFDRLTGVNLRGSYFSAQAAARNMIASGTQGRIILMSSVTGVQAMLNLSAYGMTKAAIRHIAKTISGELGEHKITVNAIAPGAILTERTLKDDPKFVENWEQVTPIGRTGYVEDIVATALFLASPEARHITGQTIVVDGGWTNHSPLPSEHPEQPEHSSQLR